jgi:hypothetical protein
MLSRKSLITAAVLVVASGSVSYGQVRERDAGSKIRGDKYFDYFAPRTQTRRVYRAPEAVAPATAAAPAERRFSAEPAKPAPAPAVAAPAPAPAPAAAAAPRVVRTYSAEPSSVARPRSRSVMDSWIYQKTDPRRNGTR